jgi:glycosyltransferase involved in cell wall biosynthesis
MPSISAIIPTAATDVERLTLLRRSVLSALHQVRAGDEVIVAGDTTDDPLDAVRDLCGRLGAEAPPGAAVRFLAHSPGHHDFGHAQINAAMAVARGEWLTFNDDDDVYTPTAFAAIREYAGALVSPAPLLFRFRSYHGPTFWLVKGLLGQGLIGGHCLVAPNRPAMLGAWSDRYEGDWDFIKGTLEKWAAVGVHPVWCDRLIAIARPNGGAR